MRRSVSANENAQVRKLVFVKKKIQTRSITPDTAREAIAGGDNLAEHRPIDNFSASGEENVFFGKNPQKAPDGDHYSNGLTPSAFRRNPYVTFSRKSKSNFFVPSGRV